MEIVSLKQVPNQTFSRAAEGTSFGFRLYVFRGMTYCDIEDSDGNMLVADLRCVPNQWMLPYRRTLPESGGNFRFEVRDDAYPWYENFGDTCNLVYYTADEIAAMEA